MVSRSITDINRKSSGFSDNDSLILFNTWFQLQGDYIASEEVYSLPLSQRQAEKENWSGTTVHDIKGMTEYWVKGSKHKFCLYIHWVTLL
jgi:hypothetical protein